MGARRRGGGDQASIAALDGRQGAERFAGALVETDYFGAPGVAPPWVSRFLRASSARFCSSCCSFVCCSSNTFGSTGGASFAFAKLLPGVSESGTGRVKAVPARLTAWRLSV